jgi:hypothetical protein
VHEGMQDGGWRREEGGRQANTLLFGRHFRVSRPFLTHFFFKIDSKRYSTKR